MDRNSIPAATSTSPDRNHNRDDRDHDRNRERKADRDRSDRRSEKLHDRDPYRRSSRDHSGDRDCDLNRKSAKKSSKKHKKDRKSSKSAKKLKYKDSSSRHRHRHSSDSDSEASASDLDGDEGFTWVEKSTAAAAAANVPAAPESAPAPELTRDSWMTGGGDGPNDALAGLFGGSRDDRKSTARAAAEEKKRNAPEGDVHISTREINPYWKMGLKGLPPTAPSSGDTGNDSDSSVSSTVSHFTMRKMDRVVEIAKEEGRSVEEVGAERFGSKEAFQEVYAAYQSSRKPSRPSGASSLRIASSATDFPPTATSASLPRATASAYGSVGTAAATSAVPTDDDMTLDEMVRRERLGIDDNMDRALISRISRDARFKDDVDYMDEESDRLASTAPSKRKQQLGPRATARKVTSMDDLVRQHKALKDCQYCFRDGGRLPDLPTIVAVGIRAYLVIVPYRSVATCQIVPVEHLVSTLEGDDEFWDEVRNFKKCLMQMYAAQNLAVLFSETVLDPAHARHTHIDVIPVPPHIAADAPGYMRTALRTDAEAHEWTQHQAVIDTRIQTNAQGHKVGGFRRCMVPNLPYVHVWYDLDGGHGHVIEERGRGMHEGFVREVIGGAMDIDPALYRRQKWLPRQVNHDRVREFVKKWEEYDWTKMLDGGEYGGAEEGASG
ncbi:CwfJ C-terminus 1-domain-containing protein-like protein [Catenaria anguillulae PL171]|uniref:CwfJ C-terminus 1-domain-containing protein-like protein n=1 Tax=Catenaria anguillulae PL171 TaxID=765915 RepID=A0A1Y2HCL5_9FUNG|nr:CwfJ C-terminus 1-domain-containing protein-like protein [Catenaria anguillulae PL171]